MSQSYWRQKSAEVIAAVLSDHPGVSGKERMDLLRDAYPFGQKANWPYTIWRQEVRYHLGIVARPHRKRPHDSVPSEQDMLF